MGKSEENESVYSVHLKGGTYTPPKNSLLKDYSPDQIFMDKDRVKKLGQTIQMTCDSFNIDATVVRAKATSLALIYTLELGAGTSIKSIQRLKADFELRVASEIEISGDEGSPAVQFSLKNPNRPLIGLKHVIDSNKFQDSQSPLSVAAGMDIQGNPLVIDLIEAPHMLISGTTGSGKSIFIDDIILSILFKASPNDVRLILVDPKVVELLPYDELPHLLYPVLTSPDDCMDAFLWVEDEMLRRYDEFAKRSVKTIDDYNRVAKKSNDEEYPRIVIIIDEFADLMMCSPSEMNEVIDRIARLGRAAGVHLILGTQLPVAKIVTPQVKANIPCRASFTVVDGRESKIILDKTGAERLLGNGDMIYSQADQIGSVHAQAAYVSESEVKNVVKYILKNN